MTLAQFPSVVKGDDFDYTLRKAYPGLNIPDFFERSLCVLGVKFF
jgi:hypothetical protein